MQKWKYGICYENEKIKGYTYIKKTSKGLDELISIGNVACISSIKDLLKKYKKRK